MNPSNGIAARAVVAAERTPFPNVGDFVPKDDPRWEVIKQESALAKLDKLPKFVKTHRAWYYWIIDLGDRALPEKEAIALYEKFGIDVRPFGHCAMDRKLFGQYLGFAREHNRKFRDDAWSPEERAEWAAVTRITGKKAELVPEGVTMWHVDSVEGLAALSAELRRYFLGEEDAPKEG